MAMQFKRAFDFLSSSLYRSCKMLKNLHYLYIVFVVLTLFSFLRRLDRKISVVSYPRFGL